VDGAGDDGSAEEQDDGPGGHDVHRSRLGAGPLLERVLPLPAACPERVRAAWTAAMVLGQRAVTVVLGPLGEPLHEPRRGRARPQPEGSDDREEEHAGCEVAAHEQGRTVARP
jgi:hypothetical protein